MGVEIPPLKIDILLESNPLKSRILVRRLYFSVRAVSSNNFNSQISNSTFSRIVTFPDDEWHFPTDFANVHCRSLSVPLSKPGFNHQRGGS